MEMRFCRAARRISRCCSGWPGAPALAPMGTMGETLLGAPLREEMVGRAETMMVGIPDSSTALCTMTEERWQVPQLAVKTAAST